MLKAMLAVAFEISYPLLVRCSRTVLLLPLNSMEWMMQFARQNAASRL